MTTVHTEELTLGKALGQIYLESKRMQYPDSIVDGNRTAIAGKTLLCFAYFQGSKSQLYAY